MNPSTATPITHPLRARIFKRLAALGPGEPAELAAVLDEPLGNVAYHFQVLVRAGAIREVSTRPVRGAVAHRYEALRSPCEHCGGEGLAPLGRPTPVLGFDEQRACLAALEEAIAQTPAAAMPSRALAGAHEKFHTILGDVEEDPHGHGQ